MEINGAHGVCIWNKSWTRNKSRANLPHCISSFSLLTTKFNKRNTLCCRVVQNKISTTVYYQIILFVFFSFLFFFLFACLFENDKIQDLFFSSWYAFLLLTFATIVTTESTISTPACIFTRIRTIGQNSDENVTP